MEAAGKQVEMPRAASYYPEQVDEGGSMVANRGKFLIGMVVLIGAMGYFAFMAFQSATVYYYTVSEMSEVGPTPDGRLVRVSGKLIPDSFTRGDGTTVASFSLTDGTQVLQATHDGVIPELFFNEHSDIILEGSHTPGGVFQSQNVIVKCPSKYVAVDDQG
ncbi:MAG: cytochrome c maturation protein CcmE [Chloroflexi bacterium]|nr:cytochrome c maturation protein CcmE [Chloroflexota bacterium]